LAPDHKWKDLENKTLTLHESLTILLQQLEIRGGYFTFPGLWVDLLDRFVMTTRTDFRNMNDALDYSLGLEFLKPLSLQGLSPDTFEELIRTQSELEPKRQALLRAEQEQANDTLDTETEGMIQRGLETIDAFNESITQVHETLEQEWNSKKGEAEAKVKAFTVHKDTNMLKQVLIYDDAVRLGRGLYEPSQEEIQREERKKALMKSSGKVGGVNVPKSRKEQQMQLISNAKDLQKQQQQQKEEEYEKKNNPTNTNNRNFTQPVNTNTTTTITNNNNANANFGGMMNDAYRNMTMNRQVAGSESKPICIDNSNTTTTANNSHHMVDLTGMDYSGYSSAMKMEVPAAMYQQQMPQAGNMAYAKPQHGRPATKERASKKAKH